MVPARRMTGWVVPLLGAAVLVMGACAPSEDEAAPDPGAAEIPDEIVIGATLPLTGEEASAGGYFKEGYEIAFDLANQDGGLDLGGETVPVTLRLLDDTSEQSTAVSLAQKLVSDGVNALLGTYSTDLVQAQATAAEQSEIPYVNGGGAATAIYSQGYKWVFGGLAPIESLAISQMEWISERQEAGEISDPARIAVLWENTSHGEDYLKGIQDSADASEGSFEVVLEEPFELDTKDFSSVLGKVEAQDVDLFMVDAHLPDFLTMHRQYITSGMCHEVITYGARGSERDAIEVVGKENVEYILSAVWWNEQLAETQPDLTKEFIDAFEAKYGRAPEWYGVLAYEAARAMFAAIEEAGSVEPNAVREALVNLEMPSLVPGGTLSFPAETGQQADYPFVVQQNLDGGSPIIFPDEVATAEGVAPNPTCKG